MKTSVHRDFSNRMRTLRKWLKTIEAIGQMASIRVPEGRAKYLRQLRKTRNSIGKLGTAISIVPNEGAYLFACAEYELAVRELIEAYAECVCNKVKRFHDLSEKLRKRHLKHSASILTEINQDRFQSSGLSELLVVQRLLKCYDPATPDYKFELNHEALSYSNNNFRWDTVRDLFLDVGITELNAKVAKRRGLRDALGGVTEAQASTALTRELDDIMLTRNRIVHRNSSMTTPSIADVRRASMFLEELVLSLHAVLLAHYRGL